MSGIFLLCSELSYIPPTEITLPCVFEVFWASLSGIWLGPGPVTPNDETAPLCIMKLEWVASAVIVFIRDRLYKGVSLTGDGATERSLAGLRCRCRCVHDTGLCVIHHWRRSIDICINS